MKVAIKYAVCFSNADGGVVVFGVSDKTLGRSEAIHGAKGYNLDTWRRGIFDRTNPHIQAEVEELNVPEGTGHLLIVRIPKGSNPPIQYITGSVQTAGSEKLHADGPGCICIHEGINRSIRLEWITSCRNYS